MQISGLDAADLDAVVFAEFTFDAREVLVHKMEFTVHDRLQEQTHFWKPKLLQGSNISYLDVFRNKLDFEQDGGNWKLLATHLRKDGLHVADSVGQDFQRHAVSEHLGVDSQKVQFVKHHQAHACHAYYGSPFQNERVAILTADAWGGD